MKTITFYSYKGGVGRSLALANVANRLSEFGKKVCIIDFDLEAPGMHLKFKQQIGAADNKKGIVDYISEFAESLQVPKKISDYVTRLSLGPRGRSNISLIKAGNTSDPSYWQKLSCIDWKGLFYAENGFGVELFYNLKLQIAQQLAPDILLIDSRTGITDIAGITMSIFADEVVLMAANNIENIEGIAQVIKTLSLPENSINQRSPKLHFVLSRIPFFTNPKDKPKEAIARTAAMRVINQQLPKERKIDKMLIIHSDPELEYEEKFKISYQGAPVSDQGNSPTGLDYLELFESLTEDIISGKEKDEFYSFLHIESLIERAYSQPDLSNQLTMLKRALQANPNASNLLNAIGGTYFDLSDFEQARHYYERVLELRPDVADNTRLYLSAALIRLNRIPEAIEKIGPFLKLYPYSVEALGILAHCKGLLKEFDQTVKIWKDVIELAPDSANSLNSLGNTLRIMGRYAEAEEYIYRSLEIDPQNYHTNGSLAELYAALGNEREFYKNLELSFSLGMSLLDFQRVLEEESVYIPFYNEPKFLNLLEKYGLDVNWDVVKSSPFLDFK